MKREGRYTQLPAPALSHEEIARLKGLLESRDFRAFIASLLDRAGLRMSIFEENESVARYAEGFRAFGLTIEEMVIQADFSLYQLMQKEYHDAHLA